MFKSMPLAVMFFVCVQSAVAQSPVRRAFILVNTAYQNVAPVQPDEPSLAALKSALTAAKFDIREERNFTQERLAKDIETAYLGTLKPREVFLFYYFGYAIQFNGDNFIVPVDFDPRNPDPVHFRARSLTGFFQFLDERKLGLKLVMIDAPMQSNDLLSRATGPGLALPNLTDIAEIAYLSSTAPNVVPVPFTPVERGLFARQAAALIQKPGTSLVELLTGTQSQVLTQNPRQSPFYLTQVTAPFLFSDPPPPPPVKPVKPVDTFISRNRVNSRDRQAYVYIPSGKFQMGCAAGDNRCEDHEKPQHEVVISKAMWMGETEVTVEAYQRFADSSTPKKRMPRAPVEHEGWRVGNKPMAAMSFEDAQAFCQFAGGRLPTEAEWEYAARGGKANEIVPMNAENARDKANFSGKQGNDRFDEVAPVKQFDPNGFGLFDMSGNLWEFTSDYYSKTYFSESPKEDPKGPTSGKERAVRGGSWFSDPAQHLRISFRNKGNGGNIVGFRCVLEDNEETRKLLR